VAFKGRSKHFHVGTKSTGVRDENEVEFLRTKKADDEVQFLRTQKAGASYAKEATSEEDEIVVLETIKPSKKVAGGSGVGRESKTVGAKPNNENAVNTREQNWRESYAEAEAAFNEDFADLSDKTYQWLYRQGRKVEEYERFLQGGGTKELYDADARKNSRSFTSNKVPQLKKLLAEFKKKTKKGL